MLNFLQEGPSTNFFGHTKFEVKKFSECFLYWVIWTLNLLGKGDPGTNFFSHPKFEVKNFMEFFLLQSALESEFVQGEGSVQQLFLVILNLSSKFVWNFLLYQALWTEFFRGGSGPTFFGHGKFETKKFCGIFSITEHSERNFLEGGLGKFFLVMPNLTPTNCLKFFYLQSTVDSKIFAGDGFGDQLFFIMPNLRSKIFWNFFLYQALWTEFSRGGVWANFFWSHQIWGQKFFGFFFLYWVLWTLNLLGEACLGTNIFWSH